MKKSLIALAISGFAIASVQAAPQANTFYLGAKAGWSSFHHDVNQFDSKFANDKRYADGSTDLGINRHFVTYGVLGGYQIIDNLAVEIGYDDFGRMRGYEPSKTEKDKKFKAFQHSAHGSHLSFKPSYAVSSNLDVLGKVGVALVRNDYKSYSQDANVKLQNFHYFKPSLIVGGGFEYALTKSVAARVEYQWISRVGSYNKALEKAGYKDTNGQYSPDLHTVTAGLSYRFGQGGKSAVVAVTPIPEVVTKNFAFSSDVLFDFGKASLKPSAAAALDAAYAEIAALGLNNPSVQVAGYTDRIGKDAPNLKLSQTRAETVANYIVSKGANPANVTAVGFGKANPVTGNTCDAVKGRKALIACLAPDRRVDIQVKGSKQVTM